VNAPPNEKAAPPSRIDETAIEETVRRNLTRNRSGFKHLLRVLWLIAIILLRTTRICLMHLPGVAWAGLNVVFQSALALPGLILVTLKFRSIRIADEKRRLELRWKPKRGGRRP
jgi:hypothetical protein